jgi:CheY-like chemotaxis protein
MTPGNPGPLVLVVDDDRDTLEMYSLSLELAGMRALTAMTAEDAVALAIEHQPDVVVTDLLLRGNATGSDLCRSLRQDPRTAHIPAVLMTGSSRKTDADDAQAAGCAEVRLKPYLPDALVRDIRTMVARSAAH